MTKNLGEVINHIMEENSTKRVLFLTNHMQIIGTVHDYKDKCKNCHDCLIALKDVKVANLKDIFKCSSDCECNLESYIEYKWFNISAHAVVGFSILSDEEY